MKPKLRKKSRRTRARKRVNPRKTRGGGKFSVSENFNTFITLVKYSFSSMFIGIFYLIACLINVPLSNLNNLSGKSFEKNNQSFLHIPFSKMISGCPVKKLKDDEFELQDDMYIHQNVAVVSCDQPSKGNVKERLPRFGDYILDFFGMIPNERKLKHHLFALFQYIDNLRETDEERKKKIQNILHHIPYKSLIQCYLIHKTLPKGTCETILKNKKTILLEEDVVQISDPFQHKEGSFFDVQVNCMWKHMTQKKFSEDDMKLCGARCNTCTFNNSVGRMTQRYRSSSSCNKSKTIRMIFNTYYGYITVNKPDPAIRFPEKADQVVPYLDTLRPQLSVSLKEKLEQNDMDEVLNLFHRLLCKYDIIPTVKEQIRLKIQEQLYKGYEMKQLLEFI